MDYYFYNTDAGSLVGPPRFHRLIEQGLAITGGAWRFGEKLEALVPGDTLLMYENGVGVVAIGTVLNHWPRESHKDLLYYEPGDVCVNEEGDECEYRIKVDWFRDLSESPISVQELRTRLGYTPRGTISKITKWRAEIEGIVGGLPSSSSSRALSDLDGDIMMDPRTIFYEQVDKFLSEFDGSGRWTTKKDQMHNVVGLVPPEWVLHSKHNGVSLQFALSVKGELCFSVCIESPIAPERRSDFKRDLYGILEEMGLLDTIFRDFKPSFERRGKFLKRTLPLLSDSYREMLDFITGAKAMVPEVVRLIDSYWATGRISGPVEVVSGRSGRQGYPNAEKRAQRSDDNEITFDDGDSDYEIDYTCDRKIFTKKAEYAVEHLQRMCKRGKLDLQPDFQRQFVWDKGKASKLIESLLLDVPLPIIYLAEDADGTLLVIDGQQRLSSIFSFIDGFLPDGRQFKLSSLRILRNLNQKGFSDIDEPYQDKLESATLSIVILNKESDKELKFEIFERLNTGSVRLNDQELRNCIYRGPYLELLKKMSEDADYRYIMGLKGPEKRMKDVEYVLHFAAFYHQGHLKYSRGMANFLNKEMEQFLDITEEQKQDLIEKFKKAVQTNKSLFGCRSFRKIRCGDATDPNSSWRNTTTVNASLYEVMMTAFLPYDRNLICRNLDAVREAVVFLMTENQEFIDTIEKWTSQYDQIRKRFEIFDSVVGAILRSDQSQERCFSTDFKERLFRLNNTCAICHQSIYAVEDAAVDHIEQYWRGGKTIPENARLTHRFCNATRRRKESPA